MFLSHQLHLLKTKKGGSMLLNSSLGCSGHQHEAEFRIDLEASHQRHGEKGHTRQYQIHTGQHGLPSAGPLRAEVRPLPPAIHIPKVGLLPSSLTLGAASDLTVTHVKSAAKRTSPQQPVLITPQACKGDLSLARETFVQNCRPLGPGHPSTFQPSEFPAPEHSPTANVLTS